MLRKLGGAALLGAVRRDPGLSFGMCVPVDRPCPALCTPIHSAHTTTSLPRPQVAYTTADAAADSAMYLRARRCVDG